VTSWNAVVFAVKDESVVPVASKKTNNGEIPEERVIFALSFNAPLVAEQEGMTVAAVAGADAAPPPLTAPRAADPKLELSPPEAVPGFAVIEATPAVGTPALGAPPDEPHAARRIAVMQIIAKWATTLNELILEAIICGFPFVEDPLLFHCISWMQPSRATFPLRRWI
jgi:hypothetical protein